MMDGVSLAESLLYPDYDDPQRSSRPTRTDEMNSSTPSNLILPESIPRPNPEYVFQISEAGITRATPLRNSEICYKAYSGSSFRSDSDDYLMHRNKLRTIDDFSSTFTSCTNASSYTRLDSSKPFVVCPHCPKEYAQAIQDSFKSCTCCTCQVHTKQNVLSNKQLFLHPTVTDECLLTHGFSALQLEKSDHVPMQSKKEAHCSTPDYNETTGVYSKFSNQRNPHEEIIATKYTPVQVLPAQIPLNNRKSSHDATSLVHDQHFLAHTSLNKTSVTAYNNSSCSLPVADPIPPCSRCQGSCSSENSNRTNKTDTGPVPMLTNILNHPRYECTSAAPCCILSLKRSPKAELTSDNTIPLVPASVNNVLYSVETQRKQEVNEIEPSCVSSTAYPKMFQSNISKELTPPNLGSFTTNNANCQQAQKFNDPPPPCPRSNLVCTTSEDGQNITLSTKELGDIQTMFQLLCKHHELLKEDCKNTELSLRAKFPNVALNSSIFSHATPYQTCRDPLEKEIFDLANSYNNMTNLVQRFQNIRPNPLIAGITASLEEWLANIQKFQQCVRDLSSVTNNRYATNGSEPPAPVTLKTLKQVLYTLTKQTRRIRTRLWALNQIYSNPSNISYEQAVNQLVELVAKRITKKPTCEFSSSQRLETPTQQPQPMNRYQLYSEPQKLPVTPRNVVILPNTPAGLNYCWVNRQFPTYQRPLIHTQVPYIHDTLNTVLVPNRAGAAMNPSHLNPLYAPRAFILSANSQPPLIMPSSFMTTDVAPHTMPFSSRSFGLTTRFDDRM